MKPFLIIPMKPKYLHYLLFLTISCNSPQRNLLEIDPRTFTDNKITLADIADDIAYIALDNSYPIGMTYPSYKILKNSIYISAKDLGVIRFDRQGKFPKTIGSIGRGPGEYIYCMSFSVDETSETVYVIDRDETIKVYSKGGKFLKSIPLPKCNDGFPFSEVEIYNSNLFVSQYINMGHAEYNWIIIDTLGNLLKQKKNSIPTFPSRVGSIGGTFKFNYRISYWNQYNDTVFTINPDLSYQSSYLFSPGEYRMPRLKLEFNSIDEFLAKLDQYIEPNLLLETNNYLIYDYYFEKKSVIAIIDKSTKKSFLSYRNSEGFGGLQNNIDGGLMFQPKATYYECNRQYLIGEINPLQLKMHISSVAYKNSVPVYPEKKTELEKLASKIKETDNPILMLVRLKN